MRISIQHPTVYRYPHDVELEPHTFRLRPRMTTTQWLLAFDLQILPGPAGTTECLDQDGNLSVRAWFSEPTRELSVRSRFTVELVRENPFDFLLIDESLNLPLWYREPLSTALTSHRQDGHISERRHAVCAFDRGGRAKKHAGVSRGLESRDLSRLPPDNPPQRFSMDVRRDSAFAARIVPRPSRLVLRCLQGDGPRGPLRQRIRMQVSPTRTWRAPTQPE
jgi:hypothetical protein